MWHIVLIEHQLIEAAPTGLAPNEPVHIVLAVLLERRQVCDGLAARLHGELLIDLADAELLAVDRAESDTEMVGVGVLCEVRGGGVRE